MDFIVVKKKSFMKYFIMLNIYFCYFSNIIIPVPNDLVGLEVDGKDIVRRAHCLDKDTLSILQKRNATLNLKYFLLIA